MRHARGAVLAAAAVLAACTPLRSRPETRYQGMLLNARDLGAHALRIEAAGDPTIRDYVARAGHPDFIVVGGPTDVELVYVPPSRVAHFHRGEPGAPSAVTEVTPIPTGLLQTLPRDLRSGTPWPLNPGDYTACWTVDIPTGPCRTCCPTHTSCVTECGEAETARR
jgi:hypothetical protein